eukprot:8880813-Alexandrium_andersonii.AAC.1
MSDRPVRCFFFGRLFAAVANGAPMRGRAELPAFCSTPKGLSHGAWLSCRIAGAPWRVKDKQALFH